MNSIFSDPWVQVLIAWGTGPLVTTLIGLFQWSRDRRDRKEQHHSEQSLEIYHDQQVFIKSLQDECATLRVERDRLEGENEKLAKVNASLRDHYIEARNAYAAARQVGSLLALQSSQPQPVWPPLSEPNL